MRLAKWCRPVEVLRILKFTPSRSATCIGMHGSTRSRLSTTGFTRKYISELSRSFADPGEKPDKLKRFPITVELFEKVHHQREPAADVFREQLHASLGYQSYQHPDKIKDGFGLVTEVQLWPQVARRLGSVAGQRVDATVVKEFLLQIVVRRNQIAHEADRDVSSPSGKRSIAASDAGRTIDWLHDMAKAILYVLDGGPGADTGKSFLLVISSGEAVSWVLGGSRMAFSAGVRREAERLSIGDTFYILTTKECWGSSPLAATLVVGVATLRTQPKDLDHPVRIGAREFTVGCDLSLRSLAPFRRGVEFSTLVPELGLIKNKKQWGVYLQRALVPLSNQDAEVVRNHLSGLVGDPAHAGDYVNWRRGRGTP